MAAVQSAVSSGEVSGKEIKDRIRQVVTQPQLFVGDARFNELATELLESGVQEVRTPITYRTWGDEGIDAQAKQQMQDACRLPNAVAAALMPDAHVGYGLPIGGVLACENAVIPYAVGVDIACRVKMTVVRRGQ